MQLGEKHQKQNVLTHLISEQHHCLIWLSANQELQLKTSDCISQSEKNTAPNRTNKYWVDNIKSIFTSDLLNFKATILICILINIEIKFIEGTWYKLT